MGGDGLPGGGVVWGSVGAGVSVGLNTVVGAIVVPASVGPGVVGAGGACKHVIKILIHILLSESKCFVLFLLIIKMV